MGIKFIIVSHGAPHHILIDVCVVIFDVKHKCLIIYKFTMAMFREYLIISRKHQLKEKNIGILDRAKTYNLVSLSLLSIITMINAN